jgi:hypothetical protein
LQSRSLQKNDSKFSARYNKFKMNTEKGRRNIKYKRHSCVVIRRKICCMKYNLIRHESLNHTSLNERRFLNRIPAVVLILRKFNWLTSHWIVFFVDFLENHFDAIDVVTLAKHEEIWLQAYNMNLTHSCNSTLVF